MPWKNQYTRMVIKYINTFINTKNPQKRASKLECAHSAYNKQ